MTAANFAADQLKSIVQRIENVQEQIANLKTDEGEIYQEAKSNGFDCKIIREIIRLRKKDPNELSEHDMLLQTYLDALGPLPLFQNAAE
jgi:uncharacterized protein (UPF0335 family)